MDNERKKRNGSDDDEMSDVKRQSQCLNAWTAGWEKSRVRQGKPAHSQRRRGFIDTGRVYPEMGMYCPFERVYPVPRDKGGLSRLVCVCICMYVYMHGVCASVCASVCPSVYPSVHDMHSLCIYSSSLLSPLHSHSNLFSTLHPHYSCCARAWP